RKAQKSFPELNARIGKEYIDLADRQEQRIDRLRGRRYIGDVERQLVRRNALIAEPASGQLERVAVPAVQNNSRSLPPQCLRRRKANASRRTRDEGDLPGKIEHSRPLERHLVAALEMKDGPGFVRRRHLQVQGLEDDTDSADLI